MKLHLLLDGEAFKFLWDWRTSGGVDEQNIEISHSQFNQLLRRFGNSRGSFRQKKMITEFVFSHSTWTTNTIDEMIKASDRGKYKTKKTYLPVRTAGNKCQPTKRSPSRSRTAELHSSATADNEEEFKAGVADLKAEVSDVGGEDDAGKIRTDDKEEEGDDGGVGAATSTNVEEKTNASSSGLHGIDWLDTKVYVCKKCNQRLLGFAMVVHHHELHEVHE